MEIKIKESIKCGSSGDEDHGGGGEPNGCQGGSSDCNSDNSTHNAKINDLPKCDGCDSDGSNCGGDGGCAGGKDSDASLKTKLNPKQVYEELQKMDFSPIDYKVKKELKTEDIKAVKEEALRFYAMLASGKNGAPSQTVDVYWHQMILNTRFYAMLGKKFRFVHHAPRVSDEKEVISEMNKTFEQTMKSYRECFGEPNAKIWGLTEKKDCSEGSENQCGSESRCQSNKGKAKIDCEHECSGQSPGCGDKDCNSEK